MPDDIKAIPATWTSLTLTQDETWQCLTGKVRISFDTTALASLGLENGSLLEPLMAVEITSGRTVRYRRAGTAPASLSRRIT